MGGDGRSCGRRPAGLIEPWHTHSPLLPFGLFCVSLCHCLPSKEAWALTQWFCVCTPGPRMLLVRLVWLPRPTAGGTLALS